MRTTCRADATSHHGPTCRLAGLVGQLYSSVTVRRLHPPCCQSSPLIPPLVLYSCRHVVQYDDLSVILQFQTAAGSTLTTPVFQGMPFITAIYKGITPVIIAQVRLSAQDTNARIPVAKEVQSSSDICLRPENVTGSPVVVQLQTTSSNYCRRVDTLCS